MYTLGTPLPVYTPCTHPCTPPTCQLDRRVHTARHAVCAHLEAGAVGLGGPERHPFKVRHQKETSRLVRHLRPTTSLWQAKRFYVKET